MLSFESFIDPDIEADLFLLPAEFGGRVSPMRSGYRGEFHFHVAGQTSVHWLAETIIEHDVVAPGHACKAKIKLMGSLLELARDAGLPIGAQFGLCEGNRTVAVGVVTSCRYIR